MVSRYDGDTESQFVINHTHMAVTVPGTRTDLVSGMAAQEACTVPGGGVAVLHIT